MKSREQEHRWLAGMVAASALLFFAWLARTVVAGESKAFDGAVRAAIHAWASSPLTAVMRGITQLGSVIVLVTLGLSVLWWLIGQGRRREAVIFALVCIGAESLSETLKIIFHRFRPEAFFGLPEPETFSFPSGHSVMSACFYGALAAILVSRIESRSQRIAIRAAAALVAFAVGLSRIYLGVHWPTDVLAGFALAAMWLGALRAFVRL